MALDARRHRVDERRSGEPGLDHHGLGHQAYPRETPIASPPPPVPADAMRAMLPRPADVTCSMTGWIQASTATTAVQRARRRHAGRSPLRRMPQPPNAAEATTSRATTGRVLRWVCTSRLPMPTTHGATARSPVARRATATRNAIIGSIRAFGCQMSYSSSRP